MGGPDHVSPASGEISSFMEANLCPVSSPHPPEYSLFQPPAPAVGVLRNQQMSNSGMDVPSSPRQPPAQPTPRPPPGRGSPRCPRSPHRASSWMRVSTVLHLPPQGALLDKGVHGAPPPPHLPAKGALLDKGLHSARGPLTGHPPGRGSPWCSIPPSTSRGSRGTNSTSL